MSLRLYGGYWDGLTSEALKEYTAAIHSFFHYSKKLTEAMEAIKDSAAFYKRYTK